MRSAQAFISNTEQHDSLTVRGPPFNAWRHERAKRAKRTPSRSTIAAPSGMGKLKIARTLGIGVSVAQRILARLSPLRTWRYSYGWDMPGPARATSLPPILQAGSMCFFAAARLLPAPQGTRWLLIPACG